MWQQYLSKLRTLGDNWASGLSNRPTEQSLQVAERLLMDIDCWYSNIGYKEFIYPRITIGPTPAGGIGIEIEVSAETIAFVTILNDKIEYEVEKNGHYTEQVVDKNTIVNKIASLYNTQKSVSPNVYNILKY